MKKSEGSTTGTISSKWRNVFVLILLIMLCYLIFLLYRVVTRRDVSSYQVISGSLALNNSYRGLVLRHEDIYTSASSGYITYFAREGEHVGVGDLLFAVDQTGDSLKSREEKAGENMLTDSELSGLRTQIANFATGFKPSVFYDSYDFSYDINGSLLKLANENVLNILSGINGAYASDLVGLIYANRPGYIVYSTDGYETLTDQGLTEESFVEDTYEKTQLSADALLDSGAPVFKLITDEDWEIVVPMERKRAEDMIGNGNVKVRILKTQQDIYASPEVISHDNETSYLVLHFNNSVVNYYSDRFLDIEFTDSNEKGLKIPLSSIVHKQFFLIPKEYAVDKGENNTYVFLRKTFLEDGTVSSERMNIDVYSEDDENYFVDDTQLRIGDYLMKNGNQQEFPVSKRGELTGVYNINKGYADFRQIAILYQNDEYAIVRSNTVYGLNEYDYIALDASTLTDDAFVFE